MRKGISALIVCVAVATACAGPVASVDETAAIQKLFSDRESAIGRGDQPAFDASLDPESPPAFKRIQREVFKSGSTYGVVAQIRVVRVEGYVAPYRRVWIEATDTEPGVIDSTTYQRRYVRQVAGRWLLTEPAEAQLGGEKVRQLHGVELHYWGIDDDVVEAAASEITAALNRAAVLAPPSVPLRIWRVTMYPTAETAGPGWTYVTTFTTSEAQGGAVAMRMYPGFVSYSASLKDWSNDARAQARIGAVLLLHYSVVPGISGRLANDWWLAWALPYAVAYADLGAESFYNPVCSGVGMPLLRQFRAGPPARGTPGYSAPSAWGYWLLSGSMGQYLRSTYGMDRYWDLLRAFGRDADSNAVFPRVIGTTPDGFYADWLRWAKKKYC